MLLLSPTLCDVSSFVFGLSTKYRIDEMMMDRIPRPSYTSKEGTSTIRELIMIIPFERSGAVIVNRDTGHSIAAEHFLSAAPAEKPGA